MANNEQGADGCAMDDKDLKNLSAVLMKKADLQLIETPIPIPEENQVLIKMHKVGICGSDVHYWSRGACGKYVVKEPMILGHESAGVVVQIGANVKHLSPGDRVAIEPGVPCSRCSLCREGRYNLCPDIRFCATPPVDGSLSRFYAHDADFCFKLPDHVTLEEGALLEPLSVAVHACKRAGVTVGAEILICGAGPIGLVTLLTAKAMGAERVCITDISAERLSVASRLGADCVIKVEKCDEVTLADQIESAFGCKPNIAIECSGADSSMRTAIYATRSGGVVVLVGRGSLNVSLPITNAATREVDIRGLFRYANCYEDALGLITSGKIDVKSLVTHRFPLEESLKAFETAKSGDGGAIKVIIECQ